MGTRGPAPKPLSILGETSRHGTERRGPEAAHEVKAPPCPRWLTPEARREWKRVVKVMTEAKTITVLDLGILASYCEAFATVERATQAIARAVERGEDPDKAEARLLRATTQVRQYAMQLGFTPASRPRVNPVVTAEKKSKVMARQRGA